MKFMTMGFLLPQSPQAILDLCRIPHPEQHQSGKTNPRHWILTGILIFPTKSGGLDLGLGRIPWFIPKEPTQTCPNREKPTTFTPQPPGMTFEQLGAG